MTVFRRLGNLPAKHRGKVRIGVLTVLVIAVILAGALGVQRLGLGKTTYDAEFGQAAGLSAGDRITVAGIQVGVVKGLRLDGDRVVATFEIDKGIHLGQATHASIKLTTLLGSRYVDLQPAGSADLEDGRIPLSNTTVPYDLQTALQDATTTFEAVDAAKIADSMTMLSEQLEGTPEILPQALENVEHLSSVLTNRREQISAMLRSTQSVTELLGRQQKSLGILITQGNLVLSDLADRREMLTRLINATTKLVTQLRPVLVDNRGDIDELLTNLDQMLTAVGRNEALLRNTLQLMPVPLRSFANASGSGNEIDFTSSGGTLIDTWMCAISGRAKQFDLPNYFQDCQ